jgi:hypothetical protein
MELLMRNIKFITLLFAFNLPIAIAQDSNEAEKRFLRDPIGEINFCIKEQPSAYQCGSYGLMSTALDGLSAPDLREASVSALAASILMLHQATRLTKDVSCDQSPTCRQFSRFNCQMSIERLLGLRSAMDRVIRTIKNAYDRAEVKLEFEIDTIEGIELANESAMKRRLPRTVEEIPTRVRAEFRPFANSQRKVRMDVSYASACSEEEYLEFGSSVWVSAR